ncbi:flagellar assembly protein FliH [Oceanobacillus limi]|uniref:Flagellar assembly protein FliH n=1 Tax=Oceanobacillus limi TaxID=930131 RepID=A0A1H9Z2F2_9BACI|nr:flagellar assembly protein FliH [Oceanobacillus limi]SES75062.1 flagellar assembly protein FliH [Oceanobacillus limi]
MSNSHYQSKKLIEIKPIKIEKEINENQETVLLDSIHEKENKLTELRNEVEKLTKQKEATLLETKQQIENEKKNWEDEKQQLVEVAKEEGYQIGFNQGKEEGYNECSNLLEQANSILQSARNDYHATIEKSDDSIIELAIHVAEKIMKQQINDHPESFVPIVKEAIHSLKDKSLITIYLHPSNHEYVLQQKKELQHIVEKQAELSILVDESAKEGTCIIEHPFGKVDASIDTQLTQLRDVLFEVIMENKQ